MSLCLTIFAVTFRGFESSKWAHASLGTARFHSHTQPPSAPDSRHKPKTRYADVMGVFVSPLDGY